MVKTYKSKNYIKKIILLFTELKPKWKSNELTVCDNKTLFFWQNFRNQQCLYHIYKCGFERIYGWAYEIFYCWNLESESDVSKFFFTFLNNLAPEYFTVRNFRQSYIMKKTNYLITLFLLVKTYLKNLEKFLKILTWITINFIQRWKNFEVSFIVTDEK